MLITSEVLRHFSKITLQLNFLFFLQMIEIALQLVAAYLFVGDNQTFLKKMHLCFRSVACRILKLRFSRLFKLVTKEENYQPHSLQITYITTP